MISRIIKTNIAKSLVLLLLGTLGACSLKSDFSLSSPDGQITATLMFDKDMGTLNYRVISQGQEIVSPSPVGIHTNKGDFRSGLKLQGHSSKIIDESYSLPQGKVSGYRNHATQQKITFTKEGQEMDILFRVYNDGVAFRFEIPGEGNIEIYEENSAIHLAGAEFTYWGQNHPNNYGYETALGPIDGELMSNPVLAEVKEAKHFVLMGQAATYGNYVQSHFERSGSKFTYRFPLDQEKLGPVRTALPFQSPWRMLIISADDPGRIVESYMVENLNPPTDPAFFNPDGTIKTWVRPGNVMWDFIARDGDKPRMWIDAAAEMGWKYYMADAWFVKNWGGMDSLQHIMDYANEKNVNVIGWAHTEVFDTPEKAAETMGRYAGWGLKGAKIDFFDHNTLSKNPRKWRDYEDTQQSLKMRDWLFELGIENTFLLEFHGNTMPTGERRQFPNLMTLEGVMGMENRKKPAANDLTIPYVRNVMGPVSYTVIHFERSPGTHAYQLAMPIVYEAGLKIYAEHGQKMLEWPGREMLQDMPAAWDEIKYIEGLPASHIVIARRKGKDWYIAGMTDEARTVNISMDFLPEGHRYHALIFCDDTHAAMNREIRSVQRGDHLSIDLLERGGFSIRMDLTE
jgi:alpha-glucosidase